jgi:hypothetical protein
MADNACIEVYIGEQMANNACIEVYIREQMANNACAEVYIGGLTHHWQANAIA